MRIVHIVESFAGGVYDFIVDLANGLDKHQHSIIYSIRENTPKAINTDFPESTKIYLWKNAQREISFVKDMLALIELVCILGKIHEFDVIHLHSSKAGFLGRIAARILGVEHKIIYTPHGVSFLRSDVSLIKKKMFISLEKIGNWFGGNIVACSKSECDEFTKYGIPAKYINNGVQYKNLDQKDYKKESKDKLYIGTIGRITEQKNPRQFNKIAELLYNDKRVKFIWIGDGELRNLLVADNIEVTGWLDQSNVIQSLRDIDIYVSTSLWEGLPLAVLQAMSIRLPLVLSDCTGNRDLVINDNNGYLFSRADEAIVYLKKLIDNESDRTIFGKQSLELIKNQYTLEKTLDLYEKEYMKAF